MKKIVVLSFSIVLILIQNSCGIEAKENSSKSKSETSSQTILNVSAEEFYQKSRDEEAMIIDVRTPSEIKYGYIEGAGFLNLNAPDFIERINFMEKYRPVFLYSRSGSRSAVAAKLLAQNGFETVYNLSGGIGEWKRSGFELVKPKEDKAPHKASMSVQEFDKVIESQNLVLVDFYTQWCAPCKKMAPVIEELKDEFSGKAKVLKVDADAQNDIAIKYEIAAVPTFILFQDGKEVWRQIGLVEKEVLISLLDNPSNANVQ